jgi:hypothetical protein
MPHFSGEPLTRWLDQPAPDRTMCLEEDFWFEDRSNRRWNAAKGRTTDGASIPRALWAIVGSPYTGFYRRAAIVHDVACEDAGTPAQRRAADRMFYEACRAGGCSVQEALILYLGVRIGAAFPGLALAPPGVNATRTPAEKALEAQFQLAVTFALALPIADDAGEVEARIDQALTAATAAFRRVD